MEHKYADSENLNKVMVGLLSSFARLAELLRNDTGGKEIQSKNAFGDIQLDTDMACDAIIFEELKKTGVVSYGLSEERPELNELGGKDYIVTFDPLDGSSIIGTNWTVGSIFGVWPSDNSKLIGMKVQDQVTSGAVLYGSRTSVIYYNSAKKTVDELTLKWTKDQGPIWVLTKENLCIKDKGCKMFSPGNLRAVNDIPQYKKCIDYWIDNGYTLRYTGGMVPDIYQIFIKSNGIYTTIASQKAPCKLRLLYEVAPLTFLTEKAGGKSTNGKTTIMETIVKSYDQRCEICVGCEEEIKRIESFLNEPLLPNEKK